MAVTMTVLCRKKEVTLTFKRISPYQNQGYVKKKFGEYDAEGLALWHLPVSSKENIFSLYWSFFYGTVLANSIAWEWVENAGFADNWM